jgi:hypothetical protein
MKTLVVHGVSFALVWLTLIVPVVRAESAAEIQKRLNVQNLDRPSDTKNEAELNSYIEDATKRGLVPQPYSGTHWRSGYTCSDLSPYGWNEYRDCMYYYRHYGHYYP